MILINCRQTLHPNMDDPLVNKPTLTSLIIVTMRLHSYPMFPKGVIWLLKNLERGMFIIETRNLRDANNGMCVLIFQLWDVIPPYIPCIVNPLYLYL